MLSVQDLTAETFAMGLQTLIKGDPDLGHIISTYGPPPLWSREPGFASLLLIILEQQVSVTSAHRVFDRLNEIVSPFSAARLLEIDDATLKSAGLTRQKLTYCKQLSEAVVNGQLALDAFNEMADGEVRRELMGIKGIGPWTADIYLLLALKRQDVLPVGDLAVTVAIKEIKRLTKMPSKEEMLAISVIWQPWRAIATRILWHYYLSTRRKSDQKAL
jgi:DNA-3-methyladenine glycosylase II